MRLFDCCKPDWLNSTLLLSSKRPLISCTLLLCSALLAIRLGQRLRLNRRAIHSSSSAEINQTSLVWAAWLSLAYAAMGEKDSALKEAERAIVLLPRAKDPMDGPRREENLALIQMIFGENSRAISTLTQLLQTPYSGWLYGQRLLRRPFLGSIRSGTLCAAIPLSKNSARKSSREPARFRSTVDSNGRTIWIPDAHRSDGKRFVARADEKLTALILPFAYLGALP